MNDELDKEIYIGIVFDLENTQIEGRWIREAVKPPFMNVASKLGLSGRIYVGGFEDMPRTHGESVFQISTYQDVEDLPKKLRDVFAGIGVQDGERFVFVVTNRIQENQIHHYQKALKMNQIKNYNNKVHFLCFGENCANKSFLSLVKEFNAKYIHIETMKCLDDLLTQIIITGG